MKSDRSSFVRPRYPESFLRHCEAQQKFADQEIERLKKRRDRIARFQEEFERYIISIIDRFAVPDRRGVKRLEGNISSMRILKNADSVAITDEKAVPTAFKDVVLTMPAQLWRRCSSDWERTSAPASRNA